MTTTKKFVVLKDGLEKQKVTFKGYKPSLKEAINEIHISLSNLTEHGDLKACVRYKSTKEMADLLIQHRLYRHEPDGISYRPDMDFELQCEDDVFSLLKCLHKMSKRASATKTLHATGQDSPNFGSYVVLDLNGVDAKGYDTEKDIWENIRIEQKVDDNGNVKFHYCAV